MKPLLCAVNKTLVVRKRKHGFLKEYAVCSYTKNCV